MLCSTTMIVVPRPLADERHCLEYLFHDIGGQPQGRLIQEQQLGAGHQAPPERQHLLLSAGHLAREVAPLLVQNGEEFHDRVHAAPHLGPVPEVRAPHLEVLLDGEVREQPSALGDERDAVLHDLVRGGRQAVPRASTPARRPRAPAP